MPLDNSLLPKSEVSDTDPVYLETKKLLDSNFAGVIFVGPPGTSKSYYAKEIACKLVDRDPQRARFIQFHPSYQYEDFVEGFVPKAGGGFDLKSKHLLEMCDIARRFEGMPCLLIIDEINRCDPGRVFGEALTYIETTKRDLQFDLASGTRTSIPKNLFFIATMNPLDRGVDEVDAALERRFAKIPMDPNKEKLREFLSKNGMKEGLVDRVASFFEILQKHPNPYARLGHAYFFFVGDEEGLKTLWRSQLRFHLEKAFRLDPQELERLTNAWNEIVP